MIDGGKMSRTGGEHAYGGKVYEISENTQTFGVVKLGRV